MKLNAPGEGAAKKLKEAGRKPAGKEYEYVNVHLLYTVLRAATLQCVGRVHMPTLVGHEMAMMPALWNGPVERPGQLLRPGMMPALWNGLA